jgi:hypothetical protein
MDNVDTLLLREEDVADEDEGYYGYTPSTPGDRGSQRSVIFAPPDPLHGPTKSRGLFRLSTQLFNIHYYNSISVSMNFVR